MNKSFIGYAGLFCLAFLSVFFFSVVGALGQEKPAVPRFERSECAVQPPEGIKAECGNLFVRENRRKKSGRTIRLPVIIIKSTSVNPAPDPVFYTAGGPGAGSLGRARGANHLAAFTKDRDFILFEQRGTGYAEPVLQCPEVDLANQESARQNLSAEDALRREARAAKTCRDRLAAGGIDLSAYDSAASAADMEDLRRTLGIKRWNLYGISYSTRLMLNYIREYPQSVRSVILDSVLPTSVNWDETGVDGVVNALNLLFADCARDKKCSAAHPDLEKKFYRLIESANEKPIVVEAVKDGKTYPVKLNGNAIFDFFYNMMERTGALDRIPAMIDAQSGGDYSSLKSYAEDKVSGRGFIWGMRYSVWCREEMPFQDQKKIAAQAEKYPFIRGFKIQGAFPEICRAWDVPPAPKIENRPVKSDVPALIFAGKYDPDTPPAWGRLVASWFSHSFFYEVEGTSHGVLFSRRCAVEEITASFLDDPVRKPDDACISEIPPLDFK
ncbi:MAG: alpha/beta fold hydrolase [Pyrinomonadaceae bacterium]